MDGNIHNLRDALGWLDRRIRDEAELDGEMSNGHAIQLGFITNMLEKFPLRQCDVGTAEEQYKRLREFCLQYTFCEQCQLRQLKPEYDICGMRCGFKWAQMPYAEEGGAE